MERTLRTMLHSEQGGVCCVLASAILFGVMPFLVQDACLHGGNAVTVACFRFTFSCLLCLPFLQAAHAPIMLPRSKLWQVLGLSLLYAATLILLFSSYGSVGAGVATTLHYIYPIVVLLLSCLLFHARLTVRHVFCLAICALGVLLLAGPESHEGFAAWGAVMAGASGLTYALYMVLLAHSELRQVPTLTMTFWLSSFAALEIGIYAALTGALSLHMTWRGWVEEACLGLFCTVFALVLFQKGLFLCGELKASLCSNVEPLTVVIIGMLAFQEPLSLSLGAGIACILTATAINALPSPQRRSRAGQMPKAMRRQLCWRTKRQPWL
ncbi:MAG: DMT family transporter [Desulfovibrio sp.]|nr:DMT family transporter [Desulfovibrio sp.]